MAKNLSLHSSPTQSGSLALWNQIKAAQNEVASRELWEEIRQAAKTNVTLQDEFERLKVIYLLSKDNEK